MLGVPQAIDYGAIDSPCDDILYTESDRCVLLIQIRRMHICYTGMVYV